MTKKDKKGIIGIIVSWGVFGIVSSLIVPGFLLIWATATYFLLLTKTLKDLNVKD